MDRQDKKDVYFRGTGEIELSIDGEKTWHSGETVSAENISGWTLYKIAGYAAENAGNALVLRPGDNEFVIRNKQTGEIDTTRHLVRCTPVTTTKFGGNRC